MKTWRQVLRITFPLLTLEHSVTLRKILKSLDDQDHIRASRLAAAGLACRLLGCPAVKIVRSDMDVSCSNDLKLHIVIPVDESEGSALKFGFVS
jgi:hypothetical protein